MDDFTCCYEEKLSCTTAAPFYLFFFILFNFFNLGGWNTFVDISLHRTFTCGVQEKLFSIITPKAL